MRRSALFPMILTALFTALLAVCSQIQIPLPYVPINLALFAVHLAAALLGPVYGTVSVAVYLLLAAVGVPVMAGFKGGVGALFGITGGYAIGYLLTALIDGLGIKKSSHYFWKMAAVMAGGTLCCYLFGSIWFMILTGNTLGKCLSVCVLPFLPGDAVKILLACLLAPRLRGPLAKWGFGR
ncbi:MAG: biotin transporter BioY [Firmicutes bacterium]|nr:biotin transporter BioY [Bacillota bacterium]